MKKLVQPEKVNNVQLTINNERRKMKNEKWGRERWEKPGFGASGLCSFLGLIGLHYNGYFG